MPQRQIDNTISRDVAQPMLHLLPVLQVDPFDRIARKDVSLSVSVSWIKEPVTPESNWIIRQPYPNQLYFAAGSERCHLGHFIELPKGLQTGEVTFHWRVNAAVLPPGHFDITHRLNLTFEKGAGSIWSMDVANWWAQSEFALKDRTIPEIGRNRFSHLKERGLSPSRRALTHETLREGCRYLDIQEVLTLPAISLRECWTLRTYGGDAISNLLETLS